MYMYVHVHVYLTIYYVVTYLFLHRLAEKDNCQLAWTMNMVSVHSMFVDSLEEIIISVSDMSFMW